jgi:2-dehydropantoate 2-reductase
LLRQTVGDAPVIIAVQNGLLNQQVLPKYFSKVIHCVVSYNAWFDAPGVVGYQKRGPLEWGVLDPAVAPAMERLAAIFRRGVPTIITERIRDAAHCKLVINLTNSVTTLVGHTYEPVTDMRLFQKLLSNQLHEGLRIVRAAGVREVKLGGMPSWMILTLGAKLPYALAAPLFKKNVKKMVLSSMAQDVIQRGAGQSELESINGYLLDLAKEHGVAAPYNEAIYELCKREFAKEKFEPLDVTEVWRAVEQRLARG